MDVECRFFLLERYLIHMPWFLQIQGVSYYRIEIVHHIYHRASSR